MKYLINWLNTLRVKALCKGPFSGHWGTGGRSWAYYYSNNWPGWRFWYFDIGPRILAFDTPWIGLTITPNSFGISLLQRVDWPQKYLDKTPLHRCNFSFGRKYRWERVA